jgi:general secretion pathway protein E
MSGSFEEYLLSERLITPNDLDSVGKFRQETGASIFSALRKASSLQPQALLRAVADFHKVPKVEEGDWATFQPPQTDISTAFLRENKIFPFGEIDDGILLAMEDPSDVQSINAVRIALQREIIPRVAAAEDILAAIERSARGRGPAAVWQEADKSEGGDDVEHLRDMALGAPVVRFVNQMIQNAVHSRATDIHIEPFDGRIAIRIRIDGMLRDVPPPPVKMSKAIVSRV